MSRNPDAIAAGEQILIKKKTCRKYKNFWFAMHPAIKNFYRSRVKNIEKLIWNKKLGICLLIWFDHASIWRLSRYSSDTAELSA